MVNGSQFVFEPQLQFVPPAPQNLTDVSSDIKELVKESNSNVLAERRARTPLPPGSKWDTNWRMIDAMNQHIYMVQRRLEAIDDIIKENEPDVRFRIAFIYGRLDDWLKDLKSIYHAMIRLRNPTFRVKKQLYFYEHALRKNIDITYTVEYLSYLHNIYMEKMQTIMPKDAMKDKNKMTAEMFKNMTQNKG